MTGLSNGTNGNQVGGNPLLNALITMVGRRKPGPSRLAVQRSAWGER